MSYCVNGFRVDFCHDRAPFVLVVVVALFMVPFLFIFSKVSKFCYQICGLGLRVRLKVRLRLKVLGLGLLHFYQA